MESWGTACGTNSSCFCRAWSGPASLVEIRPIWFGSYMEPGAISADGGETYGGRDRLRRRW